MARAAKRVNYQFPSEGMTRGAVEHHLEYAKRTLCEAFDLAASNVSVTHKRTLALGAPHLLTVYISTSDTDPVLMIQAAKLVLPHLRKCQAYSARDTRPPLSYASRPRAPWRFTLDAFLAEHDYLALADT